MKTTRVEAVVVALTPEFELAHLEAVNGDTLSIGELTEGVDWRQLQVGQRLICEVQGEYALRVVRAEVLPPAPS